MRGLFLGFKFFGYLLLVIVTAPIAWMFRSENFNGETFGEYDDDDLGEDVDDDG